MKILWCWRCKMKVPMLDEEEFSRAYQLYADAFKAENGSRAERFKPLLEYYKELTGFEESEPNAIMHHRILDYGPPCERCGKPYRTPLATFCAACGNKRIGQTAKAKVPFKSWINKISDFGILCFVLLYIVSAALYPGGSQANINSEGFDWTHNYWCNLLSETAINGEVNPAEPFAISALFILCISLLIFFVQFAIRYSRSIFWKSLIQISAVLSMLFACLIFGKQHDIMTVLSSIFGLFLLIGIIRELHENKLHKFLITAIFCILILALNNYIYYTKQYLEFLPILQKISFAIVLAWVLTLNQHATKEEKQELQ